MAYLDETGVETLASEIKSYTDGVFVELTTSKTNVTAPCIAKTFQAHLWADISD